MIQSWADAVVFGLLVALIPLWFAFLLWAFPMRRKDR